jgi:hypothetical protein
MSARRMREQTRRSYRPDDVRVLFIGESPPTGGTFFYDANSILHHATRDAFIAAAPRLASRVFLNAFQQMGCYLVDLSLEPIDKSPDADKRQARKDAVPGLARRLNGETPRVVVVVVKAILPQVRQALGTAGLDEVPREAVPFPGQWHRGTYVTELEELIRGWRRRHLLRPLGSGN